MVRHGNNQKIQKLPIAAKLVCLPLNVGVEHSNIDLPLGLACPCKKQARIKHG